MRSKAYLHQSPWAAVESLCQDTVVKGCKERTACAQGSEVGTCRALEHTQQAHAPLLWWGRASSGAALDSLDHRNSASFKTQGTGLLFCGRPAEVTVQALGCTWLHSMRAPMPRKAASFSPGLPCFLAFHNGLVSTRPGNQKGILFQEEQESMSWGCQGSGPNQSCRPLP